MNKLRKIFAFGLAVMVATTLLVGSNSASAAPANGSLVKSSSDSAVYYYNNGSLFVFPHSDVFFSWYQDFNNVMTISATELQSYPLAGNVKYRPGTWLVKTPANASVFSVGMNGTLHKVMSEQDAINLWGTNWASKVKDVIPSFFTNYTIGANKAVGMYTFGQLVKKNSSADIYVFDGAKYRRVTETGFNANHFNFAYVANVADTTSLTPLGTDVTGAEAALWNVQGGISTTTPSATFNENGDTQGSIDSIDLGSREETEALEGEEDVEIYAVDFDLADDGPLMLQRADIWFEETAADAGGESARPWDYFTEVSLMVNGAVVATQDADSSSDWSDNTTGNVTAGGAGDEYRMRFSGVEGILASDDTTSVSVAVSMQENLDSNDELATWNIELGSFRVLDESGFLADEDAADFATATALEDSFGVDAEDSVQLDVRDADEEIDEMIIEVDNDNDTNGVAIYDFSIEEQNGVDVTLEEMGMTFTVASTGTGDNENEVIKRAYLYQGDNKVGEETVADGGAVVFDNMDIALAGDSEEVFTVKVDLYDNNDATRYAEGTTLVASVGAASTFEGVDENDNDIEAADVSVSAISETHQLRSFGISVALVGSPTATVTSNEGVVGTAPDTIEFVWVFDVTAFGDETVYINKDSADIVATDEGADLNQVYTLESSVASTLTSVSGTIVSSTGANAITGDDTAYGAAYNGEFFFEIGAGQTERFTLTISGTNLTAAKQIRALLENVEYTADEVTSATAQNGSTAVMNDYTFNLGDEAATPFRFVD